jgi:soluble lytic murein transglycosylase-like protein
MNRDDTLLWILGGAVLAWLLYNRSAVTGAVTGAVASAEDAVTAAVSGWQAVNQGPVWVPVINATEDAIGIPTGLLARQAYQESHFREEIINGTLPSPAGALGILQLMPLYFKTVNVPIPYTAADTQAQISEAGQEMARLYNHYLDWGLALAAYNDGEGNIDKYLAGTRALPAETQAYVRDILADVPLPSTITYA